MWAVMWSCGFVIPWLAALILFKIDRRAVLVASPCAMTISFLFNVIGFTFNFWGSNPRTQPETLFGLPVNIGLYPVLASYMLYSIRRGVPVLFAVFFSAITLTLFEGIAVFLLHYVYYGHGWNLGWTLVSYILASSLVCLYTYVVEPMT